jgi:hypothetical protein
MKNILFAISIFLNIVLFALYCYDITPIQSNISTIPAKNMDTMDYEITSMKNFENVYFNKNDSLYKDLWNEAFENQPQSAFLISCSYFYATKDKRILKDIKVSIEQLESVYQRKISPAMNR